MLNTLDVFVNKKFSGELFYEEGSYIFSYTNNDTDFVSLTMPVRSKQYVNNKLHPLFEMHLPEGYLLSIIKKHFSKVVKTDDFGLLKLMAPSINGRISYKNKEKLKDNLTLDELLNSQSENLFSELVSRFALSSALSGVQPKVLAHIKEKATLKEDEYIVKSWGEEYPQLALNEYLCMQTLKYANIEVPEFYISKDEKLFVMKRFDILGDKCLGFEDMCVLQAKQRDDKYEGSYEQIAKVIKTFVSAKNKRVSLLQFFKMVVLNTFLKNGDAHLKNFGLLYDGIDNIRIAPAYDVVSTTVYIQKDIPALNLFGSKKWWSEKFLLRFGIEQCSLNMSQAKKAYKECIDAKHKVQQEVQERLKCEKNSTKKEILEHFLELGL